MNEVVEVLGVDKLGEDVGLVRLKSLNDSLAFTLSVFVNVQFTN